MPIDPTAIDLTPICGWPVMAANKIVTVDGSGSSVVLLPTLHIQSISSVSVLETVLDDATYEWSENGVVERIDGRRFPRRRRSVVVNMYHGWDDLPYDLLQALTAAASRANSAAGSAVQVGQVRLGTYADGSPLNGIPTASEQEVFDRYKLGPRP